jgi:hypothetical protein
LVGGWCIAVALLPEEVKETPRPYASFPSRGGADSSNPKLREECERRVGRETAAEIDLPSPTCSVDPKPVREDIHYAR